MKKIAVVYWSGTGNTQAMAEFVTEGAKTGDAEVYLYTAAEFTPDLANTYDGIAFGCSSMGAEVLEESEFQPMWDSVLPVLSNKQIALFGSYGWGDGEWMRNWEDECRNNGINLVSDCVICQEAPDDKAKDVCIALGKALL